MNTKPADSQASQSAVRKAIGPLLNAFGERQWQSGAGVAGGDHQSLEDAFEAVIKCVTHAVMTAQAAPVQAIPDAQESPIWPLIERLVAETVHRDRIHAEYMGKAMSDAVYERFFTLRDTSIPATTAEIKALLSAAPSQPAGLLNSFLNDAAQAGITHLSLGAPPIAAPQEKKLYAVLARSGEGVVFDNMADAKWAATGEGAGQDGFGYPTIAESFRDCYDEQFVVIELYGTQPAASGVAEGGAA